MKTNSFYMVISAVFFIYSCGSSNKMAIENWENNSLIEKTLYTSEEVDDIVRAILNSEHKDRPYQAPADRIWELQHSELELKLNLTEKTLDGSAILTLKPYYYPQRELHLDAKGMDIYSVELADQKGLVNGPKPDPLVWEYKDSLHLTIQFPYIINPGEPVKLHISYQANPGRKLSQLLEVVHTAVSDDKGVYFVNCDGNNPCYPAQIWTQGEPESNSRWFPTLDKPNQKHTQSLTLIFPDSFSSISNGRQVYSKILNNGYKEERWEMSQKHAVYLTMFAIGNWTRIEDSLRLPVPLSFRSKMLPIGYYVEPSYAPFAQKIFGNTPEMIQFFSQITGVLYPWDKYDQIVCREFVSGAMENTTAVIHNDRLQDPSNKMEDYISHELFHHWFGDYTTCESWSHLSMNESFATYAEYLWKEYKYGEISAQEWLYDNTTYPRINEEGLTTDELKTTPLINPHFKNANDQFDDVRYNKGAQILHELDNLIGRKAFFESMRCYLSQNAFKNGNAYDWKKCVETVTGKNMDHFFNSWYFQGGEFLLRYHTEMDSLTRVTKLILNPGIAENSMAVNSFKKYGRTKFQKVYIHILGKNMAIWDSTITFLPYSIETSIQLPFEDSMVFVTYTNPQNYNYTFNTKLQEQSNYYNQSLFSEYLKQSHYALLNDSFSYFEKVNLVGKVLREIPTYGISSYDLTQISIETAIAGFAIETASITEKPLLSKLLFEIVIELYRNHSLKSAEHLQLLQNYYDSIFAIFTKEWRLEHQVYYLNYMRQLEQVFPTLSKKLDLEFNKTLSNKWINGNSTTLFDAALMESFFSKGNIKETIQLILNSPENSNPIKAKFVGSLWNESMSGIVHSDIKKVLIPIIANQNWSLDLIYNWMDRAFVNRSREESQVLDAWIQQIKSNPNYVRVSQYYFKDEWEMLKGQIRNNSELDVNDQLRFSLLEGLFSINIK